MKELREENKLTMKETSIRLGIPYTSYINYEKGYREPNSEMFIKIANYFGVTVDYLVGNVRDHFFIWTTNESSVTLTATRTRTQKSARRSWRA